MRGGPRGLARLVAPVDPERFLAEHWERAPLALARSEPGYHDDLLTLDDLDRLLADGGLQHPGLRLVSEGRALPRSAYTEDVPWGDGAFRHAVVAERVLAEHRAGATVVFQALHRTHRPLAELCRQLERCFGFRFQANVYLTPAGERGLGVHFDRHDVFVLQVHGSKDWTLWDAPLELPSRRRHGGVDREALGEPRERLTLTAGDLLYLPRGFPHAAEARDEASAHVALGVVTATWRDLFGAAVEALDDDVAFRASLPPGTLVDPAGWGALEERFRELARRFAETAELEPLLDRMAARFAETRTPRVDGRLGAAVREGEGRAARGAVEVTDATRLVRSPLVVAHLRRASEDERTELVLPGKRVVFPAAARQALERIETGAPFAVGELPGGIDAESRRVIARRLLAEGYLVPAG